MALFSSSLAALASTTSTTTTTTQLEIVVSLLPGTLNGTTLNDKIKTLLKAIKDKIGTTTKASTLSLQHDLATYAGFTSATTYDVTKRNIDKLTFFIMFRLTYYTGGFTSEWADPLSTATGDANKWPVLANDVRSTHGIKKLNAAGEQVNSAGKHVDNSNNVLADEPSLTSANYIYNYSNKKTYEYYGRSTPLSYTGTVPTGMVTPATDTTNLFDNSVNINKVPLPFFLMAEVENPYHKNYWFASTSRKTVSRIFHYPSNVTETFKFKHIVVVVDGLFVDNTLSYKVVIEGGNPSIHTSLGVKQINFPYGSDFASRGVNLANAIYIGWDPDVSHWIAYYDNREFVKLSNDSGLTISLGVDLGAGFAGLYTIEIDINFLSTTGSFYLFYGANASGAIPANVSCNDLRSKILDLLDYDERISKGKPNPELVKVLDSSNKTSGTPAKIIISRRTVYNPTDNIKNVYRHKLHAASFDGSSASTVIELTPDNDEDRFKKISDVENDDYYFIQELLNYAFTNNPVNQDSWLDQHGFNATQKQTLKDQVEKALGCRRGTGYIIQQENSTLFKDFFLKSYTQSLRSIYHKFFIPKYFNNKRTLKDGSTIWNSSRVNKVLSNASLKGKPNVAELAAMISHVYNFPVNFNSNKSRYIKAINTHSMKLLVEALGQQTKGRKDAIKNFVKKSEVKNSIYHGIQDI